MEQLEVESKARLERRKVFHRLCALSQRGRVSAFAGSPKGLLRVPALARPRVEQPEAPRADVDRSSGSGKMVQSLPGRTADLWAVRSLCCSGSPEYNRPGRLSGLERVSVLCGGRSQAPFLRPHCLCLGEIGLPRRGEQASRHPKALSFARGPEIPRRKSEEQLLTNWLTFLSAFHSRVLLLAALFLSPDAFSFLLTRLGGLITVVQLEKSRELEGKGQRCSVGEVDQIHTAIPAGRARPPQLSHGATQVPQQEPLILARNQRNQSIA